MYQNQQTRNVNPAVHSQLQQSYTVQHDFSSAASVTATLTHALSDLSGTDVTEVEFALKDYVDPAALDALFAPTPQGSLRVDGHLSLNIRGFQTTLYGNGLISIVPPQSYQPQHQRHHQYQHHPPQ